MHRFFVSLHVIQQLYAHILLHISEVSIIQYNSDNNEIFWTFEVPKQIVPLENLLNTNIQIFSKYIWHQLVIYGEYTSSYTNIRRVQIYSWENPRDIFWIYAWWAMKIYSHDAMCLTDTMVSWEIRMCEVCFYDAFIRGKRITKFGLGQHCHPPVLQQICSICHREPAQSRYCNHRGSVGRIGACNQRHGPLARYVTLWVAHAPRMSGTFSPPQWVSDPDMHHGTCVTHASWCMPGSLTNGFLWSRWRGKRSQHSRRMRNPQFYVSGKRPMGHHPHKLHNLHQAVLDQWANISVERL